jgi:hypothetical protein
MLVLCGEHAGEHREGEEQAAGHGEDVRSQVERGTVQSHLSLRPLEGTLPYFVAALSVTIRAVRTKSSLGNQRSR